MPTDCYHRRFMAVAVSVTPKQSWAPQSQRETNSSLSPEVQSHHSRPPSPWGALISYLARPFGPEVHSIAPDNMVFHSAV